MWWLDLLNLTQQVESDVTRQTMLGVFCSNYPNWSFQDTEEKRNVASSKNTWDTLTKRKFRGAWHVCKIKREKTVCNHCSTLRQNCKQVSPCPKGSSVSNSIRFVLYSNNSCIPYYHLLSLFPFGKVPEKSSILNATQSPTILRPSASSPNSSSSAYLNAAPTYRCSSLRSILDLSLSRSMIPDLHTCILRFMGVYYYINPSAPSWSPVLFRYVCIYIHSAPCMISFDISLESQL